ncbi:MAG: PspA/IM30 family protein [Chloroflexota bacterium]
MAGVALQELVLAIADEHQFHEQAARQRGLAERWRRRAELALRVGDESLAAAARERQERFQRLAGTYERQYQAQVKAVRALEIAARPASGPRRPFIPQGAAGDLETALEALARDDRLDRDLAALKGRLAPSPPGGNG